MDFTPDNSQLKSLKTWYPVGHELHFDSRHPCIKLAGEVGELLDLYAKDEYKPNFSWWNCKHCNHEHTGICKTWHNLGPDSDDFYVCECNDYIPLVLDELGDISYYLRILAYHKRVTFEAFCSEFEKYLNYYVKDDLLKLLTGLMNNSDTVLSDFVFDDIIELGHLKYCVYFFLAILHKLDCSLEKLLELNYKKLNTENQHGWRHATVK